MTKNQIVQTIGVILTTIHETNPLPVPESLAYMAMGSDINAWNGIKELMLRAELITCHGHALRLTEKGQTLAQQINEALEKTKQAREQANAHHAPKHGESHREECRARLADGLI